MLVKQIQKDYGKKRFGCFMFLLCSLFFGKNLLLFLLVGTSSCLDFVLRFQNDFFFYLFGNAKCLKCLSFISSCLGEFPLSFLLNVFLVHQRNWLVPPNVHFHCFEFDNTLKWCCFTMKVSLLIMEFLESSSILLITWKTW